MKKILYSILMVVILLAACYREESIGRFNQVNGNHTLKARIETSANTRTIVNEENQVVWVPGDEMGVFGDKGTENVCFSYNNAATTGNSSADFSGELENEENPIFAYYPYDENAQLDGNQLTFNFPAEYDFTGSCNTPMIGEKQEDGTFFFKHLCGILRFKVENMPTDVTKLVITSTGDAAPAIAGTAIVKDIQDNTSCIIDPVQGSKDITINLSVEDVEESHTFSIPLPIGEYPLLTITFYLADGSEYFSNSIHSCLIRRATILNLGDPTLKKNGNFLVTGIEGCDGLLIANDNSLWMYKESDETKITEQMYIAMPSVVETGTIESYIKFNEQGLPDMISTSDFSVKFFNYTDNSFDIYVITDDMTYCIQDVDTEESIAPDATSRGVIEERTKLEKNKKMLNSLRVVLKGVKAAHAMWGILEDLRTPKNIFAYLTRNTINTYEFVQIKNTLDEFHNSFDNFVSNKVEYKETEIQNVTTGVLTSGGKGIVDWLTLESNAIAALKEEGVSAFLEVLDASLNEIGNALYEQEQAIIEWEAVDKSTLGVITEDAGAVTNTSATLNGELKGTYETEDKCGFIYSDGTSNEIQTALTSRIFSSQISGLKPGVTYTYNAFYTPARYQFTILGEQKSFTTEELAIITGGVEDKTSTSVVVYGKEIGGWDAHQVLLDLGICYSSQCACPTLDDCEGKVYAPKGTSGEFSVQLTDLMPNTKYYYRAFMMIDDYPVFYGEVSYFITPADTKNIKVKTLAALDITENSAVVYGKISGWNEGTQGVLGIFYSDTDKDPKRGGANVQQLSAGTAGFSVVNGEINYKGALADLIPGTTYYYRAFVYVNDVSEPILGDVKSFETNKDAESEMRDYLVKLYKDTDGDNWTNNNNWLSDEPITKWYGISKSYTEREGYRVSLSDNNLNGEIDLEGCSMLTYLACSSNDNLTGVNVANCKNLESVVASWNNKLSYINAVNCIALESFSFQRTDDFESTVSIDLSGCTGFLPTSWVSITDAGVRTLRLVGANTLTTLTCYGNDLVELDITGCTALEELDCSSNKLTTLDLSSCSNLIKLYCSNNNLTDLDVSPCLNSLKYLYCRNNKILKEVPMSFKTALWEFYYDARYHYAWPNETLVWDDRGVGWWFPGEPESGSRNFPGSESIFDWHGDYSN